MKANLKNTPRISLSASLILAALLSLSIGARLRAQVVGGTVLGTVTDPSGAVIPDAQVSIRNESTGVVTAVTTDKDGFYTAPNLLPGSYDITVSGPGFTTEERKGVTLTVGAQQVVNVTMHVGQVTQTVQVSGTAEAVQLASSAISGSVNATTVRELPLNGRSWTDLANLQPGVAVIRDIVNVSSPDRLGRGLGSQLTITGQRPQQNNYLLNGISMNDYANGAPGSILGGNLGVDAVEQFSVLTSNYSAEYGRTSGGVISAITRSGTNQFHGDVYEFLRNSSLDAANFFDPPDMKPPFRRNQFGGSAGGPIRKDKTFVFGDYEGLRQDLGLSSVTEVPSLTARTGNLCAPPDCSTTMNVGVSPLVAPYLAFYPLPNGPIFCPFATCPAGVGDTAQFSFNGFQNSTENFFTTRIDQKFSEKDSLNATYNYDGANSETTDEFKNKLIQSGTRRQIITLEETHIFSPALVNTLRLGFNRVHAASPQGATAINPLAADASLGFVPGETAGQIIVPGLTTFSGGLSTQVPQLWDWNSWQANDNAFLTRGTHAVKFGANVERIEDNSFSTSRPGGNFMFNSLQDFLTDVPQSISVDLPQFVTPRGLRQTIFGTYVQDDIRFRPNLTVNLGLRCEIASVPSEVQGKLSTLLNLTDTTPHTGNPMFSNPTLRNFEPRVGFAWDPFHNGKTSVRGGFGMFDVLPLPIELRGAVFAVWPFFDSASSFSLPPGSFPTGAFLSLAPNASTARQDYFQQNPPRNYVMQWNLNIQRELTPSTTVMAAYVGSRGVHNVLQTDDSNDVLPTLTSQGYLWPYPAGSGTPLNPNVARISATFFDSDSVYNGLQLQVTRRMSHGLQAQASYTWSKGIDTSSGSTDGDQFLNGISSLFFFDRRLRRGLSDFNVGQNLIINYTWDIPGPKSFSGPAAWALSGWELGGIYQATGGVPFTAILGGDPLGLNNIDPFDFPDRIVGPGCGSLINPGNVNNYIRLQCFVMPPSQNPPSQANQPPNFTLLGNAGRNILIGPGLSNFDMSLFKNNPVKRVSETFNVQFRLEVFNIFNRPNFAPPTDNGQNALFDGSGNPIGGAGVLDTTTTTSRQIQFALKVIW